MALHSARGLYALNTFRYHLPISPQSVQYRSISLRHRIHCGLGPKKQIFSLRQDRHSAMIAARRSLSVGLRSY